MKDYTSIARAILHLQLLRDGKSSQYISLASLPHDALQDLYDLAQFAKSELERRYKVMQSKGRPIVPNPKQNTLYRREQRRRKKEGKHEK